MRQFPKGAIALHLLAFAELQSASWRGVHNSGMPALRNINLNLKGFAFEYLDAMERQIDLGGRYSNPK